MHIGIAGNIGSGKTTLTSMLAEHYGWTPKYEAVSYNPYLEDYYKDIPRWSYNLETYVLAQRFKDVLEIANSEDTIIQDRTIFEGVYVFMQNNYEAGRLSQRDYDTCVDLFEQMLQTVRLPDLMIYLRASVPHLVSNIQRRGRNYEQTIQLDYLENLNRRYDEFIGSHYQGRVMTVNKDTLDFEHNPRDFAQVTDRIDATLFGLFSPLTSNP